MSYLNEAFKALNALNEDTFTLSDDGIKKLSEFEQNDDLSDDISVIDPEAETEDELQDSYVGKVILDCSVCHSKLYKDKEEVTLDEEGLLANVGEECPYCYTSDGFKVIGEVSEFNDKTENDDDIEKPDDDDEDTDDDDDDEALDESLTEDYSKKYIIKAKTNDGKVFYYDAELDNLTSDIERATQYAEYDIANDDLAMILGSCEDDFEFITVETVPQLNLANKDNTVEEGVATSERPMSKLDGTLGNVLTAHKDELSKVRGREDGLAFLDSIEPEVKNKGYLRKIKAQIAKIPEYKVPMLLYNLILKGDGLGVNESLNESFDEVREFVDEEWPFALQELGHSSLKDYIEYFNDLSDGEYAKRTLKSVVTNYYNDMEDEDWEEINESLNESVNNVNVETDDATVSVSQDDTGTVTVQTTPKNNGTISMSDETIVPISDQTQTEIKNNTDDDEEIDVAIDEFDEESFDELGESYLKSIYENVDSYRTTNITNYNDQIKVEGLIKFDTGNERKTSFIFESKDCTKSGKLRFIGENVEITNGKKAFTITGSLNEKKFITESFNYNYKTINEDGKSSITSISET